jgi:hypothetical protein
LLLKNDFNCYFVIVKCSVQWSKIRFEFHSKFPIINNDSRVAIWLTIKVANYSLNIVQCQNELDKTSFGILQWKDELCNDIVKKHNSLLKNTHLLLIST